MDLKTRSEQLFAKVAKAIQSGDFDTLTDDMISIGFRGLVEWVVERRAIRRDHQEAEYRVGAIYQRAELLAHIAEARAAARESGDTEIASALLDEFHRVAHAACDHVGVDPSTARKPRPDYIRSVDPVDPVDPLAPQEPA